MTTLLEKQIRANEIQNKLMAELSDLSYRAFNGERQPRRGFSENITALGQVPFSDSQATNIITKEMIKEYQDEQLSHQGATDSFGEKLKYFPTTEDYTLKVFHPLSIIGLRRPATERDVARYKNDFQRLAKELQKTRVKIQELEAEVIEVKLEIEATTSDTERRLKTFRLRGIQDEIERNNRYINGKQREVRDLQDIIANLESNIEENKALKADVERQNKEGLKQVETALMMANRNKLFVEQGLDEADADYLTRLRNIPNEKFDVNLYKDKAELNNIIKLKELLKELTRKNDIIENITKFFNAETIFKIIKIFPKIKKEFLEKYGYDNKTVSFEEIIDFIDGALNPPITVAIGAPVGFPSTPAPAPTPAPLTGMKKTGFIKPPFDILRIASYEDDSETELSWGITENCLYIIDNNSGNFVFLKIGTKLGRNCIFFSYTDNKENSFNEIKGNNFNKAICNHLNMTSQEKFLMFHRRTTLPELYKLFLDFGLKPVPESEIKEKGSMFGFEKSYGWGLKHQHTEIPKHIKFGNTILLYHKLFYYNVLSLKDKSLHSIEGLKNSKVSDDFVKIIVNICNSQNVPKSAINNLNSDEQKLFNQILHLSGMNKFIHQTGDGIIGELKNRLELIEGEIEAGNDNKELINELRDVLMKLYHYKIISYNSAKKHLKQFN